MDFKLDVPKKPMETTNNSTNINAHSDINTNSNLMENKFDEVTNFVNARYVSASESCWRTFDFNLHSQNPKTERLAIHLEGQQQVPYDPSKPMNETLKKNERTQLTEFLKLNKTLNDVKNLCYWQMPQYFTWSESKHWKRRNK